MPLSPRAPRLVLTAALALAAAGCTGDTTELAEDETGDGQGETEELPPELGGLARGLTITSVELNQGTAVEFVRDGEHLPAAKRNAPLIRERDTLVRVHHVIDDPAAWIPRELTGVLHISPPDGPELIRTRPLLVEGDSDPRRLATSFYFSLLADEARPGTELWVELRETDGSLDVSNLPEGRSTSTPAPVPVEFDDSPLELRVVLVPVRYEHLDPPREPELTDADLALFHDHLLQQNPVQRVDLRVREQPIVYTEQLTNLGSLLAPTRAAKLEDEAGPNVYYHALVDVGGPSVNQVAGIATLTNATQEDGLDRVAATVYFKHVDHPDEDEEDQTPTIHPPVGSARTFVHEVGHNQGFRHIACPNANAAGPDPDYPYADGKIGVHGFGIRDYHVYTPTASHDYMSYCGNSWASDWTWNKAFERIETLTSWDYQAAASTPATAPVLIGLLFADGSEEWSVSVGAAQPSPASPSALAGGERLEYWVAGELVASVDASAELLSDEATVMLTAPLPVALAELDGLTRVGPSGRRAVALDGLR